MTTISDGEVLTDGAGAGGNVGAGGWLRAPDTGGHHQLVWAKIGCTAETLRK